MPDGSARVALVVAGAVVLAVVIGVATWWRWPSASPGRSASAPGRPPDDALAAAGGPRTGPAPAADDTEPGAEPADGDRDEPAAGTGDPAAGDEAAAGDADPPPDEDPLTGRREPWAAVDMDEVREAMPENLYWTMSMPTTDEDVLRWREQERERWNVEYGKVLSNTATEAEIGAYYAYRQRLSEDYIEFATHLMTYYGDKLPKRDLGLLKLAVEMHLTRLEEIPRQITEANERRVAQEAARQAWLEEQRAFAPAAPSPGAAPAPIADEPADDE